MNEEIKLNAFEYFIYKLIEWHREISGIENNDLSTLKVLKLLFFVSAIDASDLGNESLLDDIFDNFHAMPYGHVESDIYNMIKNDKLINISVNNSCSTILNYNFINDIDNELKKRINKSIEKLKLLNPTLILNSSFDLVDLSHSWYSWQSSFNIAKTNNQNSRRIEPEIIKGEEKIFKI